MQKSYHLYFLKEKNDSFKKIVYLREEKVDLYETKSFFFVAFVFYMLPNMFMVGKIFCV